MVQTFDLDSVSPQEKENIRNVLGRPQWRRTSDNMNVFTVQIHYLSLSCVQLIVLIKINVFNERVLLNSFMHNTGAVMEMLDTYCMWLQY